MGSKNDYLLGMILEDEFVELEKVFDDIPIGEKIEAVHSLSGILDRVSCDDLTDFFEIEAVYPNKEKGAYCVLWADGDKTVIHLQADDEWDEEKALALCFMKHVYGSSFNEILKEWVNYD